MRKHSGAWNEGYAAFLMDGDDATCPYIEGTEFYWDWVSGHNAAAYRHTH